MKNIFTYDNVVKFVIAVSLIFIAFGANAADFKGGVSVSSDNIFRGVSVSDGIGYKAYGSVESNGLFAGVSATTVDYGDSIDADYRYDFFAGYGFEAGKVSGKVFYIDRNFNGDALEGFEDVGVSLGLDGIASITAIEGLDEADRFIEVSTPLLKVFDVAYGDTENQGDYIKVSKSFGELSDKLPVAIEVGYVDFTADGGSLLEDEEKFFISFSKEF